MCRQAGGQTCVYQGCKSAAAAIALILRLRLLLCLGGQHPLAGRQAAVGAAHNGFAQVEAVALDRIAGILQPSLLLLRSIGWLHLRQGDAGRGQQAVKRRARSGARWRRGRRGHPPNFGGAASAFSAGLPRWPPSPKTCWQGCSGRGAGKGEGLQRVRQ
jgi:hypothetical protein